MPPLSAPGLRGQSRWPLANRSSRALPTRCSGLRCESRIVIVVDLWPINSCTVRISIPAITSRLAKRVTEIMPCEIFDFAFPYRVGEPAPLKNKGTTAQYRYCFHAASSAKPKRQYSEVRIGTCRSSFPRGGLFLRRDPHHSTLERTVRPSAFPSLARFRTPACYQHRISG